MPWLVECLNNIGPFDLLAHIDSAEPPEKVEKHGMLDSRWEPLEIEYDTTDAEVAIGEIENALEKIEADNGYAAHHSSERDTIVHSLKQQLELLKTNFAYSRVLFFDGVIKPLLKVSKRLGNSVTGAAAKGALEAVTKWVKDQFLDFLG
jgi:hypothetical protein